MKEVKAVKGNDCIFFIGDNYKSTTFPYLVLEKLTTGNYHVWQVDNPNDWDEPNQYEILATIPLNGVNHKETEETPKGDWYKPIGEIHEKRFSQWDMCGAFDKGYELGIEHQRISAYKIVDTKEAFIKSLKK